MPAALDDRLSKVASAVQATQARTDAQRDNALIKAAKDFGEKLRVWRKEKLVVVTYTVGDKTIAKADYERILLAAEAEANARRFPEALTKLDEFAGLPSVSGQPFKDAEAYAKKLLEFQSLHIKDFD